MNVISSEGPLPPAPLELLGNRVTETCSWSVGPGDGSGLRWFVATEGIGRRLLEAPRRKSSSSFRRKARPKLRGGADQKARFERCARRYNKRPISTATLRWIAY